LTARRRLAALAKAKESNPTRMSPDLIAAKGGGFHTRCGAGVTSSPDGVALVSRHSVPRSARL